MFCTNCGKQIPDDSVFCPECGARIDLDGELQESKTTTLKQDWPNAPTSTQANNTVSNDNQAPIQNSKPPKKSAARIVIPVVVIAIVAVVAIAGFLTKGFGLLGDSGVNGVPVRESVNDYSWDELSQLSSAISAAGSDEEALTIAKDYHLCNPDGTLDGSQTKAVELPNGISSSVKIIGFNHDDKSDGSGKAGITFAFTEIVMYAPMSTRGSNGGGWKYSDLRAQLNSDFYDALPKDLRSEIVEVNKSTNNVGAVYDASEKTFNTSCVNGTPDKLWIPSYTEVVGDISNQDEGMVEILNGEGDQYQLYQNLNVSPSGEFVEDAVPLSDAAGVDYSKAHDPGIQWLRTPDPIDKRYAYTVNNLSNLYNEGHTVAYTYGVAPCFCI